MILSSVSFSFLVQFLKSLFLNLCEQNRYNKPVVPQVDVPLYWKNMYALEGQLSIVMK